MYILLGWCLIKGVLSLTFCCTSHSRFQRHSKNYGNSNAQSQGMWIFLQQLYRHKMISQNGDTEYVNDSKYI